MGGTLGFTLRLKSGKEYRMSRWTNWCPWAIDNMKMVNQDPDHIESVIRQWVAEQSLPEAERHWAYHNPYCAPSEYGLVIVDFQKNKLLDCNGYHKFGAMHSIGLRNEFHATNLDGGYTLGGDGPEAEYQAFFTDKENEAARWFDFYRAGRIKDAVIWNVKEKRRQSLGVDVNKMPLERVVKEMIDLDLRLSAMTDFILDMSPLEVTTFPETKEGWTAFRDVVAQDFELSDEEKAIWDERIQRYDEDE